MKIDTMLSTFVESYSKEQVEWIDDMKNDFGRTYQRHTICLADISESCSNVTGWITGYASYCVEETKKGNTPTKSVMMEAFNRLMESDHILAERPFAYPEIPSFVSGFTNGVSNIIEAVNSAKNVMLENEVNYELIGMIDECVDKFSESLQESFDAGMDKLLWASGYKSSQILSGKNRQKNKNAIIL